MKVSCLTTGALHMKPAFFSKPAGSGNMLSHLTAIALDPAWCGPFPIRCWVVETDREVILIDSGSRAGEKGGVTRSRFTTTREEELGPGLRRLGYRISDISRVFLTHLHADHVGGLGLFSPDRVRVSRAEWNFLARVPGRLLKSMLAPLPAGFIPRLFDFEDQGIGLFPRSHDLGGDGSIRALPTPGHSPGHTSYTIKLADKTLVIGGDLTFSTDALGTLSSQGLVFSPRAHRESLLKMRNLVRDGDAEYVPTHERYSSHPMSGFDDVRERKGRPERRPFHFMKAGSELQPCRRGRGGCVAFASGADGANSVDGSQIGRGHDGVGAFT